MITRAPYESMINSEVTRKCYREQGAIKNRWQNQWQKRWELGLHGYRLIREAGYGTRLAQSMLSASSKATVKGVRESGYHITVQRLSMPTFATKFQRSIVDSHSRNQPVLSFPT